jgi:hypothetical protein
MCKNTLLIDGRAQLSKLERTIVDLLKGDLENGTEKSKRKLLQVKNIFLGD